MILRFDIKDFEVLFDQSSEEFYIDLCDFKYAICSEIEFTGIIEPSIKFEFTGELEREETVLGKVYSLGKYGEERDEVFQTIEDIRNANVDVITIGQYLQPTKKHLPVKKFITPEEFNEFGDFARSLGFRHVESSPLVRSSYHAEKHIH